MRLGSIYLHPVGGLSSLLLASAPSKAQLPKINQHYWLAQRMQASWHCTRGSEHLNNFMKRYGSD